MKHPATLLAFATLLCPAVIQAQDDNAVDSKPTEVPANPDSSDQAAPDGEIRKHVVKIYSSRRSLNLSNPWKRGDIKEVTGSGVWLGDGKILTNAHVVSYSSQLYVQPVDSSDRISCEAVAVSEAMDLAILKLEDASAFKDLKPMKLMDTLPKLRSAVQAYGYPTGGSAISVTEGVVSRIEYATYGFGESGLRIQVDAGINPGNSGGPAIVEGKIAGLVYSRLRSGDNIGYLIPAEEIATFFADVEDGKFDGKPKLLVSFQRLQNDALRKRFQLKSDQTGVVVVRPPENATNYPLQADDVLHQVGPHKIDNEGMVKLQNGLRFGFTYFIPKLVEDGMFPATIIRDGKTIEIEVPASELPTRVIRPLKGNYPEYFIYGPLVFVEVTSDYMQGVRQLIGSSGSMSKAAYSMIRGMIANESPLITRSNDEPEFEDEQLIMVPVPLLPHKLSKGYRSPASQVLATVNGVKVKNLKHLVQILRDSKDEQLKFEFAGRNARYLVFNRKEVERAMEDILIDNAIARQGSKALLREWNKRDQ